MKTKLVAISGFVTLIFQFSSSTFAATRVVQGVASYSGASMEGFSSLEQLGVEREAEKDAVQKCYQAGLVDCVILNSAALTECKWWKCSATAYARGIEQSSLGNP